MSTVGQRIIEKISALPEGDRQAVEEGVLDYIDWLADLRARIAAGEADIEAGRVASYEEVLQRFSTSSPEGPRDGARHSQPGLK